MHRCALFPRRFTVRFVETKLRRRGDFLVRDQGPLQADRRETALKDANALLRSVSINEGDALAIAEQVDV